MRLNEIKQDFDTDALEEMLIESFFQYADQVAILNEDTGLYEFDMSALKRVFQKGKEYVSRAKEGVDNASRKLFIQAQDKFSRAGGNSRIVQAVTNHLKKYGKGYLAGAAVLSVLAGMPDASAADVDSLFAEMDRSPTGFTTLDIESPGGVGAEKAHQMADVAHQHAHGGGPAPDFGGAGAAAPAGGGTAWGQDSTRVSQFFLDKISQQLPGNIDASGQEIGKFTLPDGKSTVADLIKWKVERASEQGQQMPQVLADVQNDPMIQKVIRQQAWQDAPRF